MPVHPFVYEQMQLKRSICICGASYFTGTELYDIMEKTRKLR